MTTSQPPWPERIKAIRAHFGLTQTELAHRLNAGSDSSVQNWEYGKAIPHRIFRPGIEALERQMKREIEKGN